MGKNIKRKIRYLEGVLSMCESTICGGKFKRQIWNAIVKYKKQLKKEEGK